MLVRPVTIMTWLFHFCEDTVCHSTFKANLTTELYQEAWSFRWEMYSKCKTEQWTAPRRYWKARFRWHLAAGPVRTTGCRVWGRRPPEAPLEWRQPPCVRLGLLCTHTWTRQPKAEAATRCQLPPTLPDSKDFYTRWTCSEFLLFGEIVNFHKMLFLNRFLMAIFE